MEAETVLKLSKYFRIDLLCLVSIGKNYGIYLIRRREKASELRKGATPENGGKK